MKKYLKLSSFITILLLTVINSVTISQWTYCPGSINMSGLGSFPFISVVDQNTAWVAGGTGGAPKVYRTTNGGANFINASGSLTGPEFYAIWAIDANTCLVGDGGAVGGAGGNAKIWRTSDAGTTWTTVLTTGGTVGFFNGIAGLNSNRNFAFTQSDAPTGSSIFWAKTTNGGLNWTTGSTSVGGTVGVAGSLWCSSTQRFGFGMNSVARVVYTTDGGTTFTALNPSVTGTITSGFATDDNGNIMLAATTTSLPNISRSSNAGLNWSNVGVGGTISGTCVIKWLQGSPSIAYLLGLTGTNAVRKSVNGGLNWISMTTGGVTGLNDMAFTVGGLAAIGYAVASDGSVIKITDPIGDGITNYNDQVPDKYALQQNYPNPFNPSTTIKFSVPKRGFVNLKVYNSLGESISELVNTDLAAGNYSVDFNSQNLSSGIYYYTISSGDFKETRKMVLVK